MQELSRMVFDTSVLLGLGVLVVGVLFALGVLKRIGIVLRCNMGSPGLSRWSILCRFISRGRNPIWSRNPSLTKSPTSTRSP